jgi:2-polyprenyl-3-methyl-5-hydroxy-6-metoxy-1,4-benzoquinol methylase
MSGDDNDKTYFEIGPGHGEYMVTAMKLTNYKSYTAVDISASSVQLTHDYIKYSINETDKRYSVIQKNFFDYVDDVKYDTVVMGEVIEHVENPRMFLKKIHDIAKDDARIFITTACNAPEPDHIYQFNTLREVTDLIESEGFIIRNELAVNTNNIPLEIAEKKKIPIVCGFELEIRNRHTI